MTRTIFETPAVRSAAKWLINTIFKLCGWRLEGTKPSINKFVAIGVPHTSNWDFPLMLAVAFGFDINVRWMGKASLFRRPWGAFFSYCGGIPVDRTKTHNLVDQSIEQFRKNEKFVLAIAPEGTRYKTDHWKTGFYHIAVGAGVPILLAFLDYGRKTAGLGPLLVPSGDIEADFEKIRAFYSKVTARHPDQMSEISVAPKL